ncbi:AAA family ATPase [Natribacillus halophilus]|uniref:Nuclease SbcCD subunit C n=1 Tax=Natribacillus halophilus TaxID=549003 RepID=A0A1G8J6X2_9BACI|nr:SMC family ATPase [Natribacillus halophilus]SDI26926.1 exonuclease SbcC [Natribacillus halophilus]
MRPLQLNVRGLHSFREEQTIDFNHLCAGGVFGIFGPTGSGKSTILDAMTFALYGKISRSGAAGASMINQSESEVAVSFSFRLGERMFTAERRAKRNDSQLKTTRSRLIETTSDASVVLADKTGAMNREVENIIGLKIDDFTRAVVLPQNKFSEFLSLKGAERGEVLQRLFDLHKYGDELNEKVKNHLAESETQRRTIEGEQNGLGDASKVALAQARQAVVQVENELKQAASEKDELETKWKKARDIREQQNIREELLSERETLSQEQPQHERRLQALRLSAIAHHLLPYIEDKERSEQARDEAEEALRISQAESEKLEKDEKEAENIYRTAREKRQAEEPDLTVKISQLEEAETLETQLQDSAEKIEETRTEETRLQKEQMTAQREWEQATEEDTQAKEALQEKESELTTLEDNEPKREQIRRAQEKGDALKQQAQRLEEEKEAEQQAIEIVRQQAAELNDEKAQRERAAEQLAVSQSNLSQWYIDLHEAKREQETWVEAIKEAQTKTINHNQAETIRTLVAHLEEGKACPVCGSEHHPSPGHPVGQVNHHYDALEEARERLQADFQIDRYLLQLDHYSEQIATMIELSALQPPTSGDERPAHPEHMDEDAEHLPTKAQQFLHKLEAKLRSLDKLLKNTRQQIEEVQQYDANLREIETLYRQATTNQKEATTKKQKQADIYQKQNDEWLESFPEHSLSTIDDAWEAAKEEQERQLKLREEVRELQQNREQLRDHLKKAETRQTNMQMSLLQRQTELEQLKNTYQQEQARLQQWLGENTSASAALTEAKDRRQFLQSEEKTAEETFQKATRKHQEAQQQQAAAAKQRTAAIEQYHLAEERWQQQLNTSEGREAEKHFAHHEELTSAAIQDYCLTNNDRKKYEEDTRNFETRLSHTNQRLSEVEKTLDGQRVTDEEWEVLDNTLQQKEAHVEKLLGDQSVARSKWEDLQDKHHRYQELEEERQQLVTKIGHYRELANVFRGKAFVDFIAEEQLMQVTRHASERLHALTQGRYALTLDSNGGFLIADYFNGGQKRPTSTLSGGETFLTSLALALSLSVSIQLRGQHPLEFFFLDEGFGTLDAELLDTVVNALEQLQTEQLAVGVISHVPELQERLHKRLLVEAPKPGGEGSRLTITS